MKKCSPAYPLIIRALKAPSARWHRKYLGRISHPSWLPIWVTVPSFLAIHTAGRSPSAPGGARAEPSRLHAVGVQTVLLQRVFLLILPPVFYCFCLTKTWKCFILWNELTCDWSSLSCMSLGSLHTPPQTIRYKLLGAGPRSIYMVLFFF